MLQCCIDVDREHQTKDHSYFTLRGLHGILIGKHRITTCTGLYIYSLLLLLLLLLLLVILCRPLLEYSAQVTTYIQVYKLNNC